MIKGGECLTRANRFTYIEFLGLTIPNHIPDYTPDRELIEVGDSDVFVVFVFGVKYSSIVCKYDSFHEWLSVQSTYDY